MRNLLLPLALLLAACPQQVSQQCPDGTSVVGQYTLAFAPQRVPGECTVTTDGGHLTVDNPPSEAATLCAGSDGGPPQLDLVVVGKQGVHSNLLPDGGFHFESDAGENTGTACGCNVTDVQTLDGFLLTGAADAGFTLQPDGGVPPVPALSATLTDHLTSTSSSQPCLCTFPCAVTYIIVGTRF